MGQAWCKDRSSKAQDSKSPLDRVFLRCAHRIYPGLKEEGSVLGGATQRVTSSEIGYAGSPSNELLTRGSSIDSVDRPFQPSDWVDVNLEVPSTPRASSVMTNFTIDTAIYPTTTPPSSYSNSRDIVPIPPPRRKKKNCPRSLISKSQDDSDSYRDINIEPLYSSVTPKLRNNYVKNKIGSDERIRTKDIYEHKMNGTGKIISSKVVSGWKSAEKISSHQNLSEASSNIHKNTSTISLPNYDELESSEYGIKSEKINGTVAGSKDIFQRDLKSLKCKRGEMEINEIDKRQIGCDEVDSSFEITKQLRLEACKTSTPMKCDGEELRNPIKTDGWFLHADRSTRYPSSLSVNERTAAINDSTKNDYEGLKLRVPCYLFSDGDKSSYSDPFYEFDDGKKTNSLDRYRDLEPKKNHRRTLSNESEPFDSFEERRLSIEPTYRHESSPKLLTKSISEESFPSALMEDPDEVDFFDEKIVKDTKNEITKIREELEAVKNEVKTPPPSPEPIIKPELQSTDHSTLLKVLREEADESNLSSMTPSLTELEAALSDMLEKEEDQEDVNVTVRGNNCMSTVITKPLETLLEPRIVPLIADDAAIEMVDINLKNGEKIGDVSHDYLKLSECNRMKNNYPDTPEKPNRIHKISLDSLDNSGRVPTPPRRRNRSSSSGPKDNSVPDCHSNDRLI